MANIKCLSSKHMYARECAPTCATGRNKIKLVPHQMRKVNCFSFNLKLVQVIEIAAAIIVGAKSAWILKHTDGYNLLP